MLSATSRLWSSNRLPVRNSSISHQTVPKILSKAIIPVALGAAFGWFAVREWKRRKQAKEADSPEES